MAHICHQHISKQCCLHFKYMNNRRQSAACLSTLFSMLQASIGDKSFARVSLEDLSATRTSSPDMSVGEKVVVKSGGLQVRCICCSSLIDSLELQGVTHMILCIAIVTAIFLWCRYMICSSQRRDTAPCSLWHLKRASVQAGLSTLPIMASTRQMTCQPHRHVFVVQWKTSQWHF